MAVKVQKKIDELHNSPIKKGKKNCQKKVYFYKYKCIRYLKFLTPNKKAVNKKQATN